MTFVHQLIMYIPCKPRLYPFLCMDCFNLLLCIYQFQMVTSYNPGCQTQKCPECSPGVVYVQAKGDNDILHYVVSALGGPPTALVIKTNRPKERYQLNINCKMMASKNDTERKAAITLPSGLQQIYSYGVVFSRASINRFLLMYPVHVPLIICKSNTKHIHLCTNIEIFIDLTVKLKVANIDV